MDVTATAIDLLIAFLLPLPYLILGFLKGN